MTAEASLNAIILKTIRDQPGSTIGLQQLAQRLARNKALAGAPSLAALYPSMTLGTDCTATVDLIKRAVLPRLEALEKCGLVALQRHSRLPSFLAGAEDTQISLDKRFIELQRALGISLSELAERSGRSLSVTPVFNPPATVDNDVFVIMPFSPDMDDVFATIAECCRRLALTVRRGDNIFGASHIIQDVWSLIYSSRLLVCDCTRKNPNVFYELGIAHTLGKDVVLITQDQGDIPFDLRHWRYITYGADRKALANGLEASIRAIALKPSAQAG